MLLLLVSAAALSVGVATQSTPFAANYVSEPDLHGLIAKIEIGGYDGDDALYLTTPVGLPTDVPTPGSTIYDRNGSHVWIGGPQFGLANLQLQEYAGKPVLTFWIGASVDGHGAGSCYIVDDTYSVIAKIDAVGGEGADLHECNIPKDTNTTAMITVYNNISPFDLTPVGGPENGTLIDCWIQEIEIETGAVLFNWSMFEHVSPFDSYAAAGDGEDSADLWDAYHMNSIDKGADGSYLISVRHLSTIFKIDKDGSIVWRMGGKHSNFTIGDGAQFGFQHHARFNPEDNGYISLFDDTASEFNVSTASDAHGLYLSYDTSTWTTAAHTRYFSAPFKNYSTSQGSFQHFSDGSGVVGWGSNPWVTEHDSDGSVTFSLSLGDGSLSNGPVSSYRAFKAAAGSWVGNPITPPALALQNNTAYFSWNGKTAVRSWDVIGDGDQLIKAVDRAGFETSLSLESANATVVAVVAKDKEGMALGRSATVFANGTVISNGTAY
ncbi:hypothetical protein PENSPDRAFT_752335 [Peniophora sp. CONT]|nr:hypothetical protein PENSPDRAFT_752335 [Peniophora sp. CONT]